MSQTLLRLRGYQDEAIKALHLAWKEGMQRPAVVMATGLGKTVIFSHLAAGFIDKQSGPLDAFKVRPGGGHRVVVLVHRDELADQTLAKLRHIAPHLNTGKVKAEDNEITADVMVASVQTLARPNRMNALLDAQAYAGDVGLVVVDECHHATAVSYRNIMAALGCYDPDSGTVAAGFTATLARGDGQTLGGVWDDAVFQRSVLWGVSQGHLTDVRAQQIDMEDLDLGSVKRSGGDYSARSLGDALMDADGPHVIRQVIEQRAAGRRSILVFCPTVEVTKAVTDELNASGIPAGFVSGAVPREERLATYEAFRTGRVRVLVNCMVLTEGADFPYADCAVIARPTRSETMFCLDERTEILTDRGWKGVNDDLAEAQPAAYRLEDGSVHWSPLLARVDRPLNPDEGMFALLSPTADIRVSNRHRMVWRSRSDTAWRISEAQDLAQRRTGYTVPIAGVQSASGAPLTDDEIRFIGWFMTDGTMNRKTRGIAILQSEHQPWNKDIRACLEGCGFKYRVHRTEGETQFNRTSAGLRYTISYGAPRGEDNHLRGWGALEPYLSKDLAAPLEDLTRDQLAVLLHAMHLGDGSKQTGQSWTRRSYHISTGNRMMADRLQSLCVRRGFKCNVALHTYNESPLYMMHIKDTATKTVGGSGQPDRENLGPDDFRPGERVWCVETDAGTIITRRNGKVTVLGNCQMVGRVLRPSPLTGKTDALVMLLAGGGGSIRTLIDLEPEVVVPVLDGESLAEAYERQEKIREEQEADRAERERARPLRLRLKTRDLDLFKSSPAYQWLRTYKGVQFIPLGGAGEIVLWPGKDGLWDVVWTPAERKVPWERLHTGLELSTAMAWGESEAEERSAANMGRNASWRRKAASGAQVRYATRLGQTVPEGARAGDVGDLISVALASRRIDRFVPRV